MCKEAKGISVVFLGEYPRLSCDLVENLLEERRVYIDRGGYE